jgi:hypothetical protein
MPPKADYTERLTRIETKLDQALVHLQDHEVRLRKVEQAWWKQSAVIGFIIGAVTWFGPVLRKHVFGS